MGDLKISSSTYSDMTDNVEDVTVDIRNTDGAGSQDETVWQNSNFSQWFGYYKMIPEVKVAIDTRAVWTIGDGYRADSQTSYILDHVSGWGNDTFDSILENAIIIKRVGGDFFAEIIRDPDTGIMLNLKPLDPSTIAIIVDRAGIIKRYEQRAKTGDKNKVITKFKPNEIFHLTNKRVADEIHGVSDIEAIENIILANNESFSDTKKLMHRYVKPMMKFSLDTDDEDKINALVTKFDYAVNKGENLYIPKGAVEQELIAVPPNSTLNPIPWRDHLKNYFYQVVGIPQIIMGGSSEFTESTAKIALVAFNQSLRVEQRDTIMQIKNQLGYTIDLAPPVNIQNELISDMKKDGQNQQTNFQSNDVQAGVGR